MAEPNEPLQGWDLGMVRPPREKPSFFVPGKARCSVCGKSISDHEGRLFRTCEFWKCRAEYRRKRHALKKRREEEYCLRQEEFARRIGQFRDRVAESLGIDRPELFVPVSVPAAARSVVSLPEERLSALGDHLRKLVEEACEDEDESPVAPPDDEAKPDADDANAFFMQQACATCQGYCCLSGQHLAYLNKGMISRYLARETGIEPSEVPSEYSSHVPENTCEDSCVYHGERGCGLPRAMRASICNGFECTELGWLRDKLAGPGPHRIFMVGMEAGRVIRYAFVSEGDIRRGSC